MIRRQPLYTPSIDVSSALGAACVFAVDFGVSPNGYDVLRRVFGANTVGAPTAAVGSTRYGPLKVGTFSSAVLGYGDVELLPGTRATIEMLVSPDTLGQTAAVLNKRDGSLSADCFTAFYNSGEVVVQVGDATGTGTAITYRFSTTGWSAAGAYDLLHICIDVAASATNKVALYRNGVQQAASSTPEDTALSGFTNTTANLEIGRVNNSTSYFAGKVAFVRLYKAAFDSSMAAQAANNPWQLYAPLRSSVLFAPPAGGGTTVALTGVSGTGSVGSLGVQVATALSGNAGTGSVGSLAPSVSIALTGNAATGSVGSLAASVSIALTGNAVTGSVGSLTPSTGVVIALTGNEGTGSVGSLAPSVSIALSGNAVTGSVGDLTPVSGVIVALTGNSATGSVGSLAPSISIALTGNQAIGSVGSMSVLGADATVTPGQSFFELAEQSRRWREDDEPEAQAPEVIEAVKQDYERKSAVLVSILDDLEAESNDIRERIAVLEKRKTEKAERELTERKQLLAMAEVKRAIVLEEMEVMDVAYVAAAVLTLQ